jgi:hypothetical protein
MADAADICDICAGECLNDLFEFPQDKRLTDRYQSQIDILNELIKEIRDKIN